jgi:REase associating with pPIWI_RE
MTRRKHVPFLRNQQDCQRGRLRFRIVTSPTLNGAQALEEVRVRYLVTRAALRAAKAMTTPGLDPEQRLVTLMECHGTMLAARGPLSPLPFGEFRRALRGDLAGLLPESVSAMDLNGVLVVDQDGQITGDAFDVDLEQQMLLHTLRKLDRTAGSVSDRDLQAEIDQETAFTLLHKQGDQAVYEAGRADLIRRPAGPVDDLSELRLPPLVADFYQKISYDSAYRGWWFACPVCRWPMRIVVRRAAGTPVGAARCWHAPHADMGASYLFRLPPDASAPELLPEPSPPRPGGREAVLYPDLGEVPQALPAEGYKALTRGIWRYTTVPGLPELALYDRLTKRGLKVSLWPGLDAYDLLVEAGPKRGRKVPFKVDVKDYTSATTLASLVHAQEGDRGSAEWLVVPDYRAGQVPLLSGVCAKYGMKVATASEFGEMVCEKAGVSWT